VLNLCKYRGLSLIFKVAVNLSKGLNAIKSKPVPAFKDFTKDSEILSPVIYAA